MPARPIRRWQRKQDRRTAAFGEVGYLSHQPTTDTFASCSDHTDLDVTGDIDLRALIQSTDYTLGSVQPFISKYTTAGNQRSYKFRLNGTGDLVLVWSTTGADELTQASSAPSLTDGQPYWVRATMDVDDGGGNRVITFYKSSDPVTTTPGSVSWSQISQHTVAGTTSIFNGTGDLRLPAESTSLGLSGRLYWCQIFNGIAGTSVFEADWRDRDQFSSRGALTETHGKSVTWTASSVQTTWVLPKQKSLAVAGVDATPTPAVIVTTATAPQPAVDVTAGPAAVIAVTTGPTPTVIAGVTQTPAVVTAVTAAAQPAVNITVGPAVAATVTTGPTPTIVTSGDATPQPAAVATVATVPQPAVNVQAGPSTTTSITAAPQPAVNVQAGPATVAAVTAATRPAVDIAAGPSAVTSVTAAAQPAVDITVGPAVVTVPATVPDPAPITGTPVVVTPAVVASSVTVPTPEVAYGYGAEPAVIAVTADLPLPSLITVRIGRVDSSQAPLGVHESGQVGAGVVAVRAGSATQTA